jgi:hypothetical protein
MYKVLIRPVITYASETWTLSKTNERWLGLFGRKLLRCIFGAKREKGSWRKRYNYEIYEIFNEPNTVNYIKVKRLAWVGHLVCMNDDTTLKKYSTLNQMEQEVLEDRSCDGRIVLINI